MATCSSILAWIIPWTEETGGLQSKGSQRVGHNRATNTFTFTWGRVHPLNPSPVFCEPARMRCVDTGVRATRLYSFPSWWELCKLLSKCHFQKEKKLTYVQWAHIRDLMGIPGGSVGKECNCYAEDARVSGLILGFGEIPWRRARQPTLVVLPGESHGLRSLGSAVHTITYWTWLKQLSMHIPTKEGSTGWPSSVKGSENWHHWNTKHWNKRAKLRAKAVHALEGHKPELSELSFLLGRKHLLSGSHATSH